MNNKSEALIKANYIYKEIEIRNIKNNHFNYNNLEWKLMGLWAVFFVLNNNKNAQIFFLRNR